LVAPPAGAWIEIRSSWATTTTTIHHQPSTIYYQLSAIPHPPCAGLDGNVKSAPILRTGDAGIELFCYNAKLNWHIKEEKTEWVKLKLSQRKKPQV
jgi:hypothetical protein